MRRLRTSYADDWEDMEAADAPRFQVFGWSIKPIPGLAMLIAGTVIFLAILIVNSLGWLTETPWIRWTITGLCWTGLLTVLGASLVALWAMTRYLRRSRIQLARLDGATHEEALAETNRFIRWNLYARLVIYTLASVGIWLFLGSKLIFEWTNAFTYFVGLGVLVTLFIVHGAFGRQIWDGLRRIANGRR